jgi:VWFA-related protein
VPFVTPPSTHTPGVGEPAEIAAPVNLGHAPTKALDDAVYAAGQLLRDRGNDRRKVVLLISDGENGVKFNHHTYADTVGTLLGSNISVFSLAVGSSGHKKKFSRLVDYANDSGGDIYYAAKSGSMEKLYSRITEEARHEYTLAYVPTGNDKSSDYHAVRVQVARPGLTVKTRRGYRTSSTMPLGCWR